MSEQPPGRLIVSRDCLSRPRRWIIDAKRMGGGARLHRHPYARAAGIFQDPVAQNYSRQAVTTLIERNVSLGTFARQGSIRQQVIGLENRNATRSARKLTGAVIELAKVAGRLGGVHSSHMRAEPAGSASVADTIRIGEPAGAGHTP
jgi:hypothetical protein